MGVHCVLLFCLPQIALLAVGAMRALPSRDSIERGFGFCAPGGAVCVLFLDVASKDESFPPLRPAKPAAADPWREPARSFAARLKTSGWIHCMARCKP